MQNLNEHINRMKQLIGAKHGIIKPLVSEQGPPLVDNPFPPTDIDDPAAGFGYDIKDIPKKDEELKADAKCLMGAGFIKDSIGGPMTKRYVYEKTYNGTTYQINIGLNNVLSKTLIKISPNKYEECSSWSCDPNGGIGIIFSGCKQKKQMFY